MQQGITPTPDVDEFDPNADPGASQGITKKPDDDVPLPPDVKDRETVEEPGPEPAPVKDPRDSPKEIV